METILSRLHTEAGSGGRNERAEGRFWLGKGMAGKQRDAMGMEMRGRCRSGQWDRGKKDRCLGTRGAGHGEQCERASATTSPGRGNVAHCSLAVCQAATTRCCTMSHNGNVHLLAKHE